MADTMIKRAILQIAAEDGDTEAKIDKIKAKAEELGALHPEIKPRIEAAAASAQVAVIRAELKDLSKPVDVPVRAKLDTSSAGGGFGAMGYLITTGVALALAGLPAIAAAGGAAAGIALGGALLIGTQQVKGPLYSQFHQLTTGLIGILRTAALPLVQPLALAFAQIGQWAQRLKPELTAVFGSLGPVVMPLTRGLEGLVSGVMPGFLRLMRAAKPAMDAFAGVLTQTGSGLGKLFSQFAQGIGPASKVLTGFSGIVNGLLPLLGTLVNTLGTTLAPIMESLGGQVIPQLALSLSNTLVALTPLLGALGQLVATLLPMMSSEITSIAQGLNDTLGPVISGVTSLLDALNGRLGGTIGLLNTLGEMLNPGGIIAHALGSIGSAGPHAAQLLPGAGVFGQPQVVGGPVITSIAEATATYPYSSAWASGSYGGGYMGSTGPSVAQQTAANNIGQKITAALGSGIRATIPQAQASARTLMADIHRELAAGAITASQAASLVNQVQKALQSHIATVKADARKLGESLTISLADGIASSNSASTMKTAVGKLLDDVKTAYDDGIITLKQDKALSTWLSGEAIILEGIATKRANVVSEISSARQLAASTASSISGGYGMSNFATSGPNGAPMSVANIIRTLRGDVIQARQFGGNIKKLAREGIGKAYLMQLIQMGPIQGGALAQELADASLGDIKAIAGYESQISEVSGSIGKVAANIQYEGGKYASKGFLTELEKQKAALDKAGQRIAQALVRELRHDLGPGGASLTNKVEIRIVGGDKAFREWLKKSIRITGGQVQVVGA